MTDERLSDESVNEIIAQMATEEVSFLRRLISTLETRIRADMLVEKAVLKGIDDMAAKEESSDAGNYVADYAYSIGAEDLHEDGSVLAITRSQLAQCVKHFNSDNAELIDRLATINRLAEQDEFDPNRTEDENFALEHLHSLGAEFIHYDAGVLAVTNSQILKLLKDRGAPLYKPHSKHILGGHFPVLEVAKWVGARAAKDTVTMEVVLPAGLTILPGQKLILMEKEHA